MKTIIPASYIFSYWIFIWSVVYILAVWMWGSPLGIPNPTLALLIAFIWTSESVAGLYTKGLSSTIILKYVLTIVAIKAIPLFLLYRLGLPYGWNVETMKDLAIMAGLFAVYNVYLWINRTSYEGVYADLTKSVEKDDNRTPFESVFNRVFGI
jgi:hypothetical protein